MRPGVIVMKENPTAIDECRPLRRELWSQSVQLLAVEVCIDRLVRSEDLPVDYSLGILLPKHLVASPQTFGRLVAPVEGLFIPLRSI